MLIKISKIPKLFDPPPLSEQTMFLGIIKWPPTSASEKKSRAASVPQFLLNYPILPFKKFWIRACNKLLSWDLYKLIHDVYIREVPCNMHQTTACFQVHGFYFILFFFNILKMLVCTNRTKFKKRTSTNRCCMPIAVILFTRFNLIHVHVL